MNDFSLSISKLSFVSSVQSLSRVWLCNPMDCSTPGFPILHLLPELAQTHVHWVGDIIQASHPLSSTFPPAFNLSSIRVFSNVLALCIRWTNYWSFSFSISPSNKYSGLISSRKSRLVWSPCSPRDSQESSPTPQFKSICSLVTQPFSYSPILTSIHD